MNVFHRWNIVNLGNVLANKHVEEFLREIVSPLVPRLRVDLSECVELFCLRLLFCPRLLRGDAALCIVLDTEVNAHEGRDTANGWEIVDGGSTGQDPFVARRQAENTGESTFVEIGKLVGDDAAEPESQQRQKKEGLPEHVHDWVL